MRLFLSIKSSIIFLRSYKCGDSSCYLSSLFIFALQLLPNHIFFISRELVCHFPQVLLILLIDLFFLIDLLSRQGQLCHKELSVSPFFMSLRDFSLFYPVNKSRFPNRKALTLISSMEFLQKMKQNLLKILEAGNYISQLTSTDKIGVEGEERIFWEQQHNLMTWIVMLCLLLPTPTC